MKDLPSFQLFFEGKRKPEHFGEQFVLKMTFQNHPHSSEKDSPVLDETFERAKL